MALTGPQRTAIERLTSGSTLVDAATAAGVNRTTLWRWMRELEISYLLACIAEKKRPQTVMLRDAAEAVRLVEAEVESVRTGREVTL